MKFYKGLTEIVHKLSNICVWISGILLFGIALFTFVDVIGRYIFNAPIAGSQEISELAIVAVLYLGIPYSTYKRSHVRVDALTNTFSARAKLICLGIMDLLCMCVAAPIAVQMFRQAGVARVRGTASVLLRIPHWPMYYIASFGNVLLTFEFLFDAIRYFIEACMAGKKTADDAENGKERAS